MSEESQKAGGSFSGKEGARGVKTGPFKADRVRTLTSPHSARAGFRTITYLYAQPYLGNQTF